MLYTLPYLVQMLTIASQAFIQYHITPIQNCIVIAMLEMFKKEGCEVVLCEGLWCYY